jgi:hypothetical protein
MARPIETYSGYCADERPTRFLYKGQSVEVKRILSQWREPDAECFRILGDDGQLYRLRHEKVQGEWLATKT